MFEKIDVNGKEAHPLFVYLKKQAPGAFSTEAIKWNFTKFLVDRKGTVLKRYAPTVNPKEIAPEIENCFSASLVSRDLVVMYFGQILQLW